MKTDDLKVPTFWKRAAATWIDLVLLVGVYFLLGFLSEHLYRIDAYPPPSGMQLYSEREFLVFWFFVRTIFLLTLAYQLASYKIFKATLGQKLTQLKVFKENGDALDNKNILLRLIAVFFTLFVIFIPGPIIAMAFFHFGSALLNPALSMLFLVSALLGFLYFAMRSYTNGQKKSFSDMFSKTILRDISK